MTILITFSLTALVVGFLWHEDRTELAEQNAQLRRDLAAACGHPSTRRRSA